MPSRDAEGVENTSERIVDEKDSLLYPLLNSGVRILHKVSFPVGEKKSVDYIAMYDRDKILLKIERRVSSKDRVFQELKKLSRALNVNALIIADRFNSEKTLDDVLYIRDRVGIVSRETLDSVTSGERVYIYEYSGMYYVKINGRKLQRLRTKMGYSLHELAQSAGISSKALQKYEEGEMDMSAERAYRFMELFGALFEEVLRSVDIFRDRIVRSERRLYTRERYREVESGDRRYKLALKLSDLGADVEVFDTIPTDLLLQLSDVRVFMTYINGRYSSPSVELKCRDNKSLASTFNGLAISVIDGSHSRESIDIAEDIGEVRVVSDIEGFARELAKSLRR
ncbi:MAG: helix-turn-helix domain-containing protein [Ignisphaera sp.]|nr:helix-turn-helix domain-containing protein [Ignisphaera sp.]MCX8168052.1 helix-turn-helix domain-containing protein [Ignisphaera sp.]MDW8085759.1 helix-turn-helix domain-containing protein [Ignisphaera sp.]